MPTTSAPRRRGPLALLCRSRHRLGPLLPDRLALHGGPKPLSQDPTISSVVRSTTRRLPRSLWRGCCTRISTFCSSRGPRPWLTWSKHDRRPHRARPRGPGRSGRRGTPGVSGMAKRDRGLGAGAGAGAATSTWRSPFESRDVAAAWVAVPSAERPMRQRGIGRLAHGTRDRGPIGRRRARARGPPCDPVSCAPRRRCGSGPLRAPRPESPRRRG